MKRSSSSQRAAGNRFAAHLLRLPARWRDCLIGEDSWLAPEAGSRAEAHESTARQPGNIGSSSNHEDTISGRVIASNLTCALLRGLIDRCLLNVPSEAAIEDDFNMKPSEIQEQVKESTRNRFHTVRITEFHEHQSSQENEALFHSWGGQVGRSFSAFRDTVGSFCSAFRCTPELAPRLRTKAPLRGQPLTPHQARLRLTANERGRH